VDQTGKSDLSNFFAAVGSAKREQKQAIDSLLGDIDRSFDALWEQLKSHKTVDQIAQKHKVPVSKIKKQLEMGTKVETEHTNNKELASYIALQHLDELPDYYDRLKTVEKKSPKASKKTVKEETLIEKSLGFLAEPSDTKVQNDPLTPLNQNFVTAQQLQDHYKKFLSRIQQQLSTLGGGGETNLTYMDVPVTYVTTSTYSVTHKDYYIGVNYAGAVTITLPYADREGKKFVVKDELGEASKGTNRYITILPSGSDLIDGRDRAILAYDYGSLTFIWRGNSWRVV
jgi:ribosomal protein L7Ae-like RNA K-turn-binding protein